MAITKIFTRDELEELDAPYNCIWSEIVGTGRWSTYHTGVFWHDGSHWRVDWQEPATEDQECDEWFDEDTVTATKVVNLPVVKHEWVEASE